MHKDFQAFLDQIAAIYGLPSLAPDNKGACQLRLHNENLSILFEYDNSVVFNTILLSSPLEEVHNNSPTLLIESFQHNYLNDEVVSIQPAPSIYFLHRRFDTTIEQEYLQNALASFVHTATLWKNKLK